MNPNKSREEKNHIENKVEMVEEKSELKIDWNVEQAVEELRKNEVSEEQLKAFDEWIEDRKAEAKAEAERKMSEPIEQWPLPF